MKVSVVIPALDAERTIGDAIQSLQAQTHADWEAVVVDDGSADGTAEIVERFASADPRITLIRGEHAGVSEARNRGLGAATAEWVLFLDADDWIKPTHMEKMLGRLAADRSLGAVCCAYSRSTESGAEIPGEVWWDTENVFPELARHCLWAIHACIVRRSLVEKAGGFPPGWRTCEDWDLWLRIARMGTRFGAVHEALAVYRVRRESASMDGIDMARGSLAVVDRGHAADPRVTEPHPDYAAGVSAEKAPAARYTALVWSAGLMMAGGDDARALLAILPEQRAPALDPFGLAVGLFHSMVLPPSLPLSAWSDIWAARGEAIRLFLGELERRSGAAELTRRTVRQLEQMILLHAPPRLSTTIGTICSITVETASPLLDVRAEPGVERLAVSVLAGGAPAGRIFLPVCDRFVPAAVLADAVAAELTWQFLDPYVNETIFKRRGAVRPALMRTGKRAVGAAGRILRRKRRDFVQWANASLIERALVREIFAPPRRSRGLEANAEAGRLALDISLPLPSVRTDGDRLELAVHAGGRPVGPVAIDTGGRPVVPAGEIRRSIVDACGFEICRIVVRDLVLGRHRSDWRHPGEELARRARGAGWKDGFRDAEPPPGRADRDECGPADTAVIGRHRGDGIGTGASRRAALPSATLDDLIAGAEASGEAIALPPGGPGAVRRVVYDPEGKLLPPRGDGPRPRPLDAASRSRRAFDITSRLVERSFPAIRRKWPHRAVADRLPILMYHRIAEEGPSELAPYRVSPAAFEEQIRCLEERGYYSVGLEEWRAAKERRRQLRGRPVLITFDDGYADFLDAAWPVLERHRFGATVFLVANEIGGTTEWDRCYGPPERLMGWEEIRTLAGRGVAFGSHTLSHPPLTALSPAEVVREGARSRAILEKGLARPVKSIAYPFGDADPVVSHLMGACGYVYGVTCHADVSRYADPLLALPRITVEGGMSPERLVRAMERRFGEER